MSTVSSSSGIIRKPFRTAVWVSRLFLVACLLAAMAFAWFVIVQLFAARELAKYTDDLKSRGIPYDNATLQTAYQAKTYTEGSETLQSILQLSSWGLPLASVNSLPLVGASIERTNVDESIFGWKEWPTDAVPEKIVSDYLEEMEPMFRLLDELEKMPKPVRLELEMDGYGTRLDPLQESRRVLQVLSLEARYAIFKKDKARVLRAIKSMETICNAIDSQSFLVVDYMLVTFRSITQSVIQESMTVDLWDLSEIQQLKGIVESDESRTIPWRRALEWERAMAVSSIESSSTYRNSGVESIYWIPKFPSAKLKVMKHYDDYIEAAELPREQKLRTLASMEQNIYSLSNLIDGTAAILGLVMPSVLSIDGLEERDQDSAKFAIIACGIRQFKLSEGRLPTGLVELTTVGVPSTAFSTADRGRFGYEIEDGKAWLWSYDLRDRRNKVTERRPTDPSQFQYQPTLAFE